jgi:WXG100 family type VII secretion target
MPKVIIGSAEFKVDLQQLSDAITKVTADRSTIETDFRQIRSLLDEVRSTWVSPAGSTFPPLEEQMATAMQSLLDALEDMIVKMRTTHANYLAAEGANVSNLTARTVVPAGPAVRPAGNVTGLTARTVVPADPAVTPAGNVTGLTAETVVPADPAVTPAGNVTGLTAETMVPAEPAVTPA